jgi:hypothetical protein
MFDRITLQHFRHAGRRRVRTARELVAALRHGALTAEELVALRGLKPAMGGAEQALQVVANAAVVNAAATYIGPILNVPQDPLVLALFSGNQITAMAAAETVQFNMRRTDTPAQIAQLVVTNPGAGASTMEIGTLLGIVPFGIPAGSGVDVQQLGSVATGSIAASATAPSTLALLGVN